MTFISYSQNYEDVMLWRALKHVTHGFYVDIGAWSPDVDSVTKAFYEAGWHGINVEPNPEFYGLLVQKRTKDINLQFAVSDTSGEQEMTFLSDLGSGMSTLDSKIAQRHHDAGWQCTKQMVQVTTLAKLWKENVLTGQDVHFLKVDVEGFEGAVLQGNDWTCFRPWIIVVEATLPMVQIESHEPWEGILLQHGYRFTYADGLNRFYVAEERHSELFYSFKYPPNVFDDFILVRQVLADAQAKSAQEHLQETQEHLQETQEHLQETQEHLQETQEHLQETQEHLQETLARAERVEANVHECNNELIRVYQSNSWQITKPLRWINRKLRRFWH